MKDVYVLYFCKRHSEQDHKGTLGGECEAGGVMLGSEWLRGSNGGGGLSFYRETTYCVALDP